MVDIFSALFVVLECAACWGFILSDKLIKAFNFRDEELATELAWVIVYLSALSNTATAAIVKTDIVQLLVETLAASNSLQLLIPVTCELL